MISFIPILAFAVLLVLLPAYIIVEYRTKSPWKMLIWKSACSLLFLITAAAAMLGAPQGWQPAFGWFMAAFLLSAAGDVLLAWPIGQSFQLGLGAFLLAQCSFAAAFSLRWGLSPWDAAVYAALAGAAVLTLRRAPGMEYGQSKISIIVYALALSAMAAKAVSGTYLHGGAAAWLAAAGGLLFYGSDVVLAFIMFNRRKPKCLRAVNLALYYVGQGLLAVSLCFK
jgi:uncharacterized membrane protein YhhN